MVLRGELGFAVGRGLLSLVFVEGTHRLRVHVAERLHLLGIGLDRDLIGAHLLVEILHARPHDGQRKSCHPDQDGALELPQCEKDAHAALAL